MGGQILREIHAMPNRTVAIHQPNYLPWTGYFLKMAVSDVFVFHDNVKITKAGPTRRVQIAGNKPDHNRWLSVPLQKHSDFTLIKDVLIFQETHWMTKHLSYVRAAYYRYPYFKPIFALMEEWLDGFKNELFLARLNAGLIQKIALSGNMHPIYYFSSELPASGYKGDYNISLVKILEGKVYISGKGGAKYQEEKMFSAEGVRLLYADTMAFYETYIEKHGLLTAKPACSVIDFLMLVGVDGFIDLLGTYKNHFNSIHLDR
jgi:hypothetical protein